MYNVAEIKTAFEGLIGWRQNPDQSSGTYQLNSSLTTSSSGLYFNDVHPTLNFENIRSVAPDFNKIGNDQTERNTLFSNWLKEKTDSALIEAVQTWFSQKSELNTANNLLESIDLFTTTSNFNQLQNSSTDLVGHRYTPCFSKNLRLKIEKIKVQFDTNQVLQLHLFQSGIKDAIHTVNIDYTGNGSVQEETVNWVLKAGYSYFLTYDAGIILGNAINGIYDFDFTGSSQTFPSGKFYEVSAFRADVDSILTLWDLNKTVYTNSTNFGLNTQLSVYCDYTDLIVQQKHLFQMLFYYSVANKLMREIAFNSESRVNRNVNNEKLSMQNILYEIDGDTQGRNRHTVFGKYEAALNSIQFDSSGIDPICLPCEDKGVNWGSIGPQ